MRAIILDRLTDKTYKTDSKGSEKQVREDAEKLVYALYKKHDLNSDCNRFEFMCIEN